MARKPFPESQRQDSDEDKTARDQSIRLKRQRMSWVSYALQMVIVLAIYCLRPLELGYLIIYVLSELGLICGFYLVVRLRCNLHFRDANLALPQILAPALPGLVLLYQMSDAQSQAALALTAVVPLLYGIFRLNLGRFIVACVVYGLGYLLVMATHAARHHGSPLMDNNWVLVVSLLVVMLQIGLIGGFINQLQRDLRDRNADLDEAMQRIAAMAVRDDLTGLYNRRWLVDVLLQERTRFKRTGQGFCICLLDVDHFKQINDTYGHGMGDHVLVEFSKNVSAGVRDVDTFGRLGGEEFLWIMPASELAQAYQAAERVRRQVAALSFIDDDGRAFSITVSMGIAHSQAEFASGGDSLLHIADDALYSAKHNGRNRIVIAGAEKDASLTPAANH